ncbi:hypothetical protein BDZ91DRAFT_741415 [Kalaharituber pfeilii]|nr:hypothetical protein BDZ91DRAFT_741415 [Kalaharituber pfeilii]
MAERSPSALLTLPPELLLLIIRYLPHPHSPYASVCRAFLPAVESITFHAIHLKSTDLPRLPTLFTPAHRRRALGSIDFDVVLPPYDSKTQARRETEEDQRRNNAVFGAAVQQLLGELASWDAKGGITLIVRAYAEIDELRYKNLDDWSWNTPKTEALPEGGRYKYSFLHLGEMQDEGEGGEAEIQLPIVPNVEAFYAAPSQNTYSRHYAAAAVATITRCFPRLRHAVWSLWDSEHKDVRFRKRMRSDFARIIARLQLPNLTTLSIDYPSSSPLDHAISPPVLCTSPAGVPTADPLSRALHALTTRCPLLKNFSLTCEVVLSPEIFWPTHDIMNSDDNAPESPIWPCMEEYHLSMNMLTPAGGWYYLPDPNLEKYDDDDYWVDSSDSEPEERCRSFRTRLDPAEFRPLLQAMSRAVRRMPKLRRFLFEMNRLDSESSVEIHGLGVGQPGGLTEWQEDGTSVRRWHVYFGSETGWGATDVEGDVGAMWKGWVGHAGVVRVHTWSV